MRKLLRQFKKHGKVLLDEKENGFYRFDVLDSCFLELGLRYCMRIKNRVAYFSNELDAGVLLQRYGPTKNYQIKVTLTGRPEGMLTLIDILADTEKIWEKIKILRAEEIKRTASKRMNTTYIKAITSMS